MLALLTSVSALLLSTAIFLVGHGLQLTLIPLYAVELNWSSAAIGYVGSSYFLGFVAGCLIVPRLVTRVGHIRVFAVLIAAATAALLMLAIVESIGFWLVARFVTGLSMAGVYMLIESWLNEKTAPEFRGSVLSVYTVISLVAICGGQLLVGIDMSSATLFMLAAVLLVLGVVPVGLTTSSTPSPIPVMKFEFRRIIAGSQVAMVGAFFGGVVTGGFWTLGPVVAQANGLTNEEVGYFMAAALLGGAAFQYPIGHLSDGVDRRYVIAGVAVFGVLASVLAMVLSGVSTSWTLVTMLIFGGMTFPLYSLCLAHANDNSDLSLMQIASGVLMVNSVGSVVGPVLVAWLLGYSSYALFIVATVALSVLAAWTLFRVYAFEANREFYEPFVDVPKTSYEITGMVDDTEFDEAGNALGDETDPGADTRLAV